MGLWKEAKKKSQKSATAAYKKKTKDDAKRKKASDSIKKKKEKKPVEREEKQERISRGAPSKSGTASHRTGSSEKKTGSTWGSYAKRASGAEKARDELNNTTLGKSVSAATKQRAETRKKIQSGKKIDATGGWAKTDTLKYDNAKAEKERKAKEKKVAQKQRNVADSRGEARYTKHENNVVRGKDKFRVVGLNDISTGNVLEEKKTEAKARKEAKRYQENKDEYEKLTKEFKAAGADIPEGKVVRRKRAKQIPAVDQYELIDEITDEDEHVKKALKQRRSDNVKINRETYDKIIAKKGEEKAKGTLKSDRLTYEEYQKMMNATRMGNPDLANKALGKDLAEKIGSRTAYSAGKAKFTAGFLQGLAPVDTIHGGVGTYNKSAKGVLKDVKESDAYEGGYMAGFMGQFLTSGAGAIGQGIGKTVVKGGGKALGKNIADETFERAGRRFVTNRVGEMVAETPINIGDAIKMSTDENGKVDRKELAKYLALNSVMTIGGGGLMEGAGVGLAKKDVRLFEELRGKQNAGTITQEEASKLRSLNDKIKRTAANENTASGTIARNEMPNVQADRVYRKLKKKGLSEDKIQNAMSRQDLQEYFNLQAKGETGPLSKQEARQLAKKEEQYQQNVRDYTKELDDEIKGLNKKIQSKENVSLSDAVKAIDAVSFANRTGNKAMAKEATKTFETIRKNVQNDLDAMGKKSGAEYVVATPDEINKALADAKYSGEFGELDNGIVIPGKDGKKRIYVNMNSEDAYRVVIGHETTHLLSKTDSFGALKDAIKTLGEENGDYKKLFSSYSELYADEIKGMSKEKAQEYIEEEVTAQLVGKYLFGDASDDFIKTLSKDKSAFRQVYDIIVEALNKILKSGEKAETAEADALKTAKEKFEQAYKEMGETPIITDPKHSKSKSVMIGDKEIRVTDDAGKTTKEADDMFMKAAKSEDMETCQKLVDAQLDSKGFTVTAYHGSNEFGFTEFNLEEMQKRDPHNNYLAVFTTNDVDIASTYTKSPFVRKISDGPSMWSGGGGIYKGRIKPGRTLVVDTGGNSWKEIENSAFMPSESERQMVDNHLAFERDYDRHTKYMRNQLNEEPLSKKEYIERGLAERRGYGKDSYREMLDNTAVVDKYRGRSKTRAVAGWARAKGYDSVELLNVFDIGRYRKNIDPDMEYEDYLADIYVTFRSDQFKVSDPVTYRDDGSIIPLSERGNEESPDFRFSKNVGEKTYQSGKWIADVKRLETPGISNGELLKRVLKESNGVETRAIKKLNTYRRYRFGDQKRMRLMQNLGDDIDLQDLQKISLFVEQEEYAKIRSSLMDLHLGKTEPEQYQIYLPSEGKAYDCVFDGDKISIINIEGGLDGSFRGAEEDIANSRGIGNGKPGAEANDVETGDGRGNHQNGKPNQEKGTESSIETPSNGKPDTDGRRVTEPPKGGSFNGEVKKSKAQTKEADDHRKAILDDAESNYGSRYTDNPNESGFIFPDGKMPKMGAYGSRYEDHAIAGWFYDDISYATSQTPKADAMGRFLNEGNIRIAPENRSIELGSNVKPTNEQFATIRKYLRGQNEARIEFTDGAGKAVDSKAYENGVNAEQVINDIKRFYSEGKIGGSELNNFRFSKSTKGEAKEDLKSIEGMSDDQLKSEIKGTQAHLKNAKKAYGEEAPRVEQLEEHLDEAKTEAVSRGIEEPPGFKNVDNDIDIPTSIKKTSQEEIEARKPIFKREEKATYDGFVGKRDNGEITPVAKEEAQQNFLDRAKEEKTKIQNAKTKFMEAMVDNFYAFERIGRGIKDAKKREQFLAQINELRVAKRQGRSIVEEEVDPMYKKYGLDGKKNAAKRQAFEDYCFLMHNRDRIMHDTDIYGKFVDRNAMSIAMKKLEDGKVALRKAEEDMANATVFTKELRQARKNAQKMISNAEKEIEQIKRDGVAKVDEVLEDMRGKYGPEIEKFQQNVVKFFDALNKRDYEAGLIGRNGRDGYIKLKKEYPNYVPTFREKDFDKLLETETFDEIDIKKGMRATKGGEDPLIPLYNQMISKTNRVMKRTEENRMMQMVADVIGGGVKAEEIPAEATPIDVLEAVPHVWRDKGQAKVLYYVDGVSHEVEISDDLFREMSRWTGDEKLTIMGFQLGTDPISRTTSKGARLFKSAITDYNVLFGIKNAIRDQQTALLFSKDRVGYIKAFPKVCAALTPDWMIKRMPKRMQAYYQKYRDVYKVYMKSGGKYSPLVNSTEKAFEETMKKWNKLNPFQWASEFNAVLETFPRMQEFTAAIDSDVKKLVKSGMSEESAYKRVLGDHDSVSRAMYRSKDITVNFDRGGTVGRWWNSSFVPFLNPSIQGLDKTYRWIVKDNKTATEWVKMLATLSVGVGGAGYLWEMHFNENEDYKALTNYYKDNYYCLPVGDGKFIKIPKAREIGALQNPLDHLIRQTEFGEPGEWKEMFKIGFEQLGPVSPLTDNLFMPAINTIKNRNWYGGNIENADDQRMIADGQSDLVYDEKTSLLAIKLGKTDLAKKYGVSPKKIDNLMDSYLGVVYDMVIGQFNQTNQSSDEKYFAERTVKRIMETNFIVDSYISNKYSGYFYDKNDKIFEDLKNAKKGTQKYRDATAAQRRYRNNFYYDNEVYNNAIAEIKESKKLTAEQKAEKVRMLRREQRQLQEDSYNGKETSSVDVFGTLIKEFGLKKTINEFTYTSTNAQEGEYNPIKKAFNKFLESDTYKKKGMAPFKETFDDLRKFNKAVGESSTDVDWDNSAFILAQRARKTGEDVTDLRKSFGVWDSAIERANKYYDNGGSLKEYKKTHKLVVDASTDLGYEYTNQIDDAEAALALAKGKTLDRGYYAEKIDKKTNPARCVVTGHGWTAQKLSTWAAKNGISSKKCDQYNPKYDDNDITPEYVAKCIEKNSGEKTREGKAGLFALYFPDEENPFGEIGDYSLDGDAGIKEGGKGRRGRRRGRRGRGGRGGGGGGGPDDWFKYAEDMLTKTTRKKLSTSRGRKFTTKSQLNEAYRRRARAKQMVTKK